MQTLSLKYVTKASPIIFAILYFLILSDAQSNENEYINTYFQYQESYSQRQDAEILDKWNKTMAEYKKNYEFSPDRMALFSLFSYSYTEHDLINSIRMLEPCMQDVPKHPMIPYTLWTICYDGLKRSYGDDQTVPQWKTIRRMHDTPVKLFQKLCAYWSRFVPSDFECSRRQEAMLSQHRSLPFSHQECLDAWLEFLKIIRKLEMNIKKAQIAEEEKRELEISRQKEDQKRAEEKQKYAQAALKELDKFFTLPNTEEKAVPILFNFQGCIDNAKTLPRIPNYEKLVENVGKTEADVVNLYFHLYVTENYKRCLELISGSTITDERVAMVKYLAQTYLQMPDEERLASLETVLRLNPKNKIAKRNQIYLTQKLKK